MDGGRDLSVVFLAVCVLQFAILAIVSATEQTTASSIPNSNATVSFTNATDMTNEQQHSAITIEFRLNGRDATDLTAEEYRRLRQAILDELNRRHRRGRRRRRTTAASAPPTTEDPQTTAAEATTKEIAEEYFLRRRRRDNYVDFDDYSNENDEEEVQPGSRLRRQADDDDNYYYDDDEGDYYTEDDLQFILLDPLKDGVIRVAVALDKQGETDADADLLQEAAETLRDNGQLESEVSTGPPGDLKTTRQ